MPDRRLLVGGAAVVVALAVVAILVFTGGEEDVPVPEPSPTEVEASPPAADPVCPLTGKPPPRGVKLGRPAVAVKVENSPQARPQHGLERADLVFEEMIEGGYTRFMAIFHCGQSKDVGPVRSARFDDPELARPFTRVIAFSGSNSLVLKRLQQAKMVALNELNQRTGFFRVPPGAILVHNLFARTEALRKDARARKLKPPRDDVFTFGPVPKDAPRARRVQMRFSGSVQIEYRYRRGTWARFQGSPFLSNSGKQIAPENVLIQEVEVNNSRRLLDSAGNPSPTLKLRGGGRALLFRDGRVIRGTWKIRKGRPVYRTRKGTRLQFARGSIWVELLPSKKGQVKGSFSIHRRA